MAKIAYVCLVEVIPLDECELDPAEYEGAMVRCYVGAKNEQEARRLVRKRLTKDKFSVVEVEWWGRDTNWENPNDRELGKFLREAEAGDTVIYGRFDAWRKK
jgi:hypothetical protein